MNCFETLATVNAEGHLLVAGVPFAPGTEVEVTISPVNQPAEPAEASGSIELQASREQMQGLFRTITGFRQTPRFSREELYDRPSLR